MDLGMTSHLAEFSASKTTDRLCLPVEGVWELDSHHVVGDLTSTGR